MFSNMGQYTAPFSLDLSSFDTSSVTTMTNMFAGMFKLKEITLGEKFAFVGTDGYLPAQSSANIPYADGKWYNSAGEGFAPSEIPAGTADTYSAVPSGNA